jgi:hypothetical protein
VRRPGHADELLLAGVAENRDEVRAVGRREIHEAVGIEVVTRQRAGSRGTAGRFIGSKRTVSIAKEH